MTFIPNIMWNPKTRLLTLLLLLLTFFIPSQTEASHFMGADISYECIGQCTVRVRLKIYRDCSGSSFVSATPFAFIPQTPGCGLPTPLTSSWPPETVTEVTPVCTTFVTQCQGASPPAIAGVEEFFWERDYDVCANPNCVYILTWTDCCRNGAISSINSPGSADLSVGATTLNTGIQPCNNSPYFTNPPVPYICQGQPFTFNQGAIDPEGDSLRFSLGPCFTSSGTGATQVSYAGGYSPSAPLGPSWNVTINPATGDVTALPTPGNVEVGIMCIYVEEYRNGVLINTIVRDMQMTVISCPNNIVPTSAGVQNVTGGVANSAFEITVCAGTPMSFTLPVTDPDVGQIQTLYWNQSLANLGATFGFGVQNDTIIGNNPVGTFNWMPQNTGIYQVLFTAVDDACPILGQNQYTVTINVNGGLPNAGITGTPTGCTNVNLNANPGNGNTGPYTYMWFGDGNLNLNPNINAQTLNHTYPGPGSYEANVLITDSYGCQSVLTDTIIIPNGPTADAGPTISVCSGFPVQLGAAPIAGQTYAWFPTTNLSNSTSANPIFLASNPGPLPDTIDYTLSATAGFCTALDYVRIIVYPTPVVTTNGNQQICLGDNAVLTASGASSYTWSTNETTPSITVSPTQTTTYTVIGSENGCSSPPVSVTVTVTPGPTAIISGTDSVCAGEDANLTVVGGDSWLWSNNATSQTITLSNIQSNTTVSVVPSDNGCPGPAVSYTVSLHEQPAADFTNTTVCFGNSTAFTDVSSIAAGNVTDWEWNFGDPLTGNANNTSTNQNPDHLFSSAGTFPVTLTTTSSKGCVDAITRNVTVNPLPTAEFTFSKACAGFEMNFTDGSSSGVAMTNYLWDFGDGSNSSQQNPSHTYPNAGSYNVTLTVTDANGCDQSVTKTVFAHPNPVAEFSYELSCFQSIGTFTSSSFVNDPFGSTLDAHAWNFGDPSSGSDNTSNAANPVHAFTSPGTYNVTLTVTTSQGCTHTIVRQVEIPGVPPLLVQNDEVCKGFPGSPLVVGNVLPNTTVGWYYNANSNEAFHYGRSYTTPPLDFNTVYYVAMIDESGCISTKIPVWVYVNNPPAVSWEYSTQETEIPNAIIEIKITDERDGPIVEYVWDFGDGNTSNIPSPVHQYEQEGIYDMSLLITDDFGCETYYDLPRWVTVTKEIAIWVPNAFTPNNDGINDQFYVVPRLIRDFHIDLFDRWGKHIYASDNQNFRWNGSNGTDIGYPEGVYTYRIRAVEIDGQVIIKAGTVTLYR